METEGPGRTPRVAFPIHLTPAQAKKPKSSVHANSKRLQQTPANQQRVGRSSTESRTALYGPAARARSVVQCAWHEVGDSETTMLHQTLGPARHDRLGKPSSPKQQATAAKNSP